VHKKRAETITLILASVKVAAMKAMGDETDAGAHQGVV